MCGGFRAFALCGFITRRFCAPFSILAAFATFFATLRAARSFFNASAG